MEEIINKLQTENELQKQKQVIKFELTVLVNVWMTLTLCLRKIDFGDINSKRKCSIRKLQETPII